MTNMKILVVDDDEALLETTRELLEREGYEVFVHHGAFGTVARAQRLMPDLVLLDVHMPGLSGERLVDVLRGDPRTATIPVLFHSSNDEGALRRLSRDFGVQGYVCKGDPGQLRLRVARMLSRGP